MIEAKDGSNQKTSHSTWLVLALLVQTLVGASMVPVRYLQTVVGLPGLSLIALSDLVAFSIMAWRMFPRIEKRFWRSKTLWVMVVIVILRTVCLTFAVRYTKVYLVQLINLLAPFMVVYLERVINKSPIPKFTLLATTLTTMGGAMMVFGEFTDLTAITGLSIEDGMGVLLAFLGTIGIALYMVIVNRSEKIHLPFEAFYISQIGSMMIVMFILSFLVREDWSSFQNVDWRAGLALAFNAFIVEIVLKVGNIAVIRKLGAATVSSMQAVRLVAALFVGWIVLNERLASIWQWVGAIVVVITVTWYVSNNKPISL